mgnify:CR=1 FL=1
MISRESVFKIGTVGRIHGVKGEVSIHITDEVFDRVDIDYLFLEVEGLLVPFFMEEYRFKSDTTVLMKFCDIDSADQATALTGCDIYFPRDKADDGGGELSWSELVGFTVVDSDGHQAVGEIIKVDLTTINTLFEVRTADGKTVLIPAADELVDDVDRDHRTITLRIPEGILNL